MADTRGVAQREALRMLGGLRLASRADRRFVAEHWILERLRACDYGAALRSLRDWPGDDDPAAAQAWALTHHVAARWMLEIAQGLRARWRVLPARGETVDLVYSRGQFRFTSSPRPDGIRARPLEETCEEFLARAKAHYVATKRAVAAARAVPRWDRLHTHCAWFVDVQVRGLRPADVARTAGVDRKAVERGWRSVAALVEMSPRPLR